MSSSPLSIRFDRELLGRLRLAADLQGSTPSGLSQVLIDEGLRARQYPGIIFRDGPSGRRAALAIGPDVWEIITALAESEVRGDAAIEAVAIEFDLEAAKVRLALAYYGSYQREIDAEMAENERAATAAFASWQAQQQLLA